MFYKRIMSILFIWLGLSLSSVQALISITTDTVLSGTYNDDIEITYGVVTLGSNVTVNGTITIIEGELRIDTYTLNVTGNLSQQPLFADTLVHVGAFGDLVVGGDYNIIQNSYFEMTDATSTVTINGNFSTSSVYSHSGKLNYGTLIVHGNFTQYLSGAQDNFKAGTNHKVVLAGSSPQQVTFTTPQFSGFGTLEVIGSASVYLGEISVSKGLKVNPLVYVTNLTLNHSTFTLTDNLTIYGPFNIKNSTINANANINIFGDVSIQDGTTLSLGYSQFNVTGNLTQSGGTLNTGTSTTTIGGNYDVINTSYFIMTNVSNVTVDGDFSMESSNSHASFLTNGTLTVKGRFDQKNYGSPYNFDATGDHKVILSGSSLQYVIFTSPLTSGFNILEVNNAGGSVYTSSEISIKGNFITSTSNIQNLRLNTTTLTLQNSITLDHGFTLKSGTINCQTHTITTYSNVNIEGASTLNINNGTLDILNLGNLTQNQTSGALNVGMGTIYVTGDYLISGSSLLTMLDASANVTVDGSFTMQSSTSHTGNLTDGTLTIKGQFAQLPPNTSNFDASLNHKVVLSGSSPQQVIFLNSPPSKFANLDIMNTSLSGVTFPNATSVTDTLTANNCQTRLDLTGVTYGTLDADDSCVPLSVLIEGQTHYFVNETGSIGHRVYDANGTYTGEVVLPGGNTINVSGTYTISGDTLTLYRNLPTAKTIVLTYLGENAGIKEFSVSIDGGAATLSSIYETAQERDDAVLNASLLTIVDTTKYFLSSNNDYGNRTFNTDDTYTGTVYLSNGTTFNVDGNYAITDNVLTIDRVNPSPLPLELIYLGEDAGVMDFNISVNGGPTFQTSFYSTKAERNEAGGIGQGASPAVIMYLLN